jgi:hypothetical protein
VDTPATGRWGHRPATSGHPRFGASRWPQPPARAVTFHPNRADRKKTCKQEGEERHGLIVIGAFSKLGNVVPMTNKTLSINLFKDNGGQLKLTMMTMVLFNQE